MNIIDVEHLREIINKCIRTIKELREENEQLHSELRKEQLKKEKAIEEINKLENDIKERH
ncbi:hypothetical protein KAW18_05905 [candidate division WOR-3 bacterium]|nr:hypothetical protein [candidate division WOR-3 bacterium]MCK4526885.1 hypothetical protein [candidate division WOR-3 bacterium]